MSDPIAHALADDTMLLTRIFYEGNMQSLRKEPDWVAVQQDERDKIFRVYWWWIVDDAVQIRDLASYHRRRAARLGCETWEFPDATTGRAMNEVHDAR